MLKTIIYTGAIAMLLLGSCKNEEESLPIPSELSNVRVYPRVGAITVKWDYPQDSAKTQLVQVRYQKNGRTITTNVSLFADSAVISGLINKLEYTFEVQPFNADMVGGKTAASPTAKPLRRPVTTTYDPESKTAVPLTNDLISTFTQESSEGPKENLIDGNRATYWHSAWSSNTSPLPHWIQLSFPSVQALGGIRYFVRQSGGNDKDSPSKWDLQTSNDGVTWTTVWTSRDDIPTTPRTTEQIITFGKNFSSKYFRVRIIKTPSMNSYTALGEFAVYSIAERTTDLEEVAEKGYK